MCFTEDYPDGRNFKSGDSRLSHLTGYDEMLFFDDSMWSDHSMKERAWCPGVTQRTPRG